MTVEEIQRIIEQMLTVQQELQNSQVEFKQSLVELRQDIDILKEATADLKEVSQRHERRIEQLIGYSITGESERLDLLQKMQNLEIRVNRLEQNK